VPFQKIQLDGRTWPIDIVGALAREGQTFVARETSRVPELESEPPQ
jgi:hypothetical protein